MGPRRLPWRLVHRPRGDRSKAEATPQVGLGYVEETNLRPSNPSIASTRVDCCRELRRSSSYGSTASTVEARPPAKGRPFESRGNAASRARIRRRDKLAPSGPWESGSS